MRVGGVCETDYFLIVLLYHGVPIHVLLINNARLLVSKRWWLRWQNRLWEIGIVMVTPRLLGLVPLKPSS